MASHLAQFEIIFVGIWLMVAAVGVGLLVFWIWMLVDCLRKEFDGDDKLIWILVIVLAGWLGAIIYFFVGRPKGRLPGQTYSEPPPPEEYDAPREEFDPRRG